MADVVVPAQYRLRVKRRMAIVAYAREHGIKPAGRHFGLARRTVRTWLRRWQADGPLGLVPQYPGQRERRLPVATVELIRLARTEFHWGAPRTRAWLEGVHGLKVTARTSQRVFHDIGVPLLTTTQRRLPPQVDPPQTSVFETEQPGDAVGATDAAV
jgi:transposase